MGYNNTEEELEAWLERLDAEIGYGFFTLSPRRFPWMVRPAALHDKWYRDINEGNGQMTYLEADLRFYKLVEMEINNPSITPRKYKHFARLTLHIAKKIIPAFRLLTGKKDHYGKTERK